ncbi:MAG: sphingomyelin phosphodiesterase, partial [Desulfobacteraceae bacterium]|nr:sphingomyelin phosphodiesterase [Desulfobacteraceae bacterium]
TTESTWHDSGYTEYDILAGSYIVEYLSVSGWNAPGNQEVTIYADQTTNTSGTYIETVASSRPDLRVMGYNIMQLPVQDWDQDQRLAHLPDAIRALADQPDVIAFSEVLTDDAYNTLESLSDVYPYLTPIVGQVCSGGGWDSITGDCSDAITVVRGGMCIASKWPILEQHAYIFVNSIFGSADYQANKGAAYIEIDKNGYIYHVLGTHLQATHDGDADTEHEVRMAQLDEMKTWIDSFGIPASEPVILAGDMNVDFSLTDQIIDMLLISNTALNFPNDQGFGSYPEDNWMSRAFNYYFGYDMCYDDTLDYVLTRTDHLMPATMPAMEVVPLKAQESWYWSYLYGTWPLCSGSYWHDGYTTDLSDHYPVAVTYTYAP